MSYGTRIDCFTSLDDLKPKERKDPEAVLAVLRRVRRFSVWDMDNAAIRSTVMDLEASGRIVTDTGRPNALGFPWVGVTVIDQPTAPAQSAVFNG